MHPIGVLALILVAAAVVAGAVTLRAQAYGYLKDGPARRRCFLVWLTAICAIGAVFWALERRGFPARTEWALLLVLLPLVPPTVLAVHDYRALAPWQLMKGSALLAGGGALAAASMTLLRPVLGDWSLAGPAAVAVLGLYGYLAREAGARDGLIGLLALLALGGAIWGLATLLERLGVPL